MATIYIHDEFEPEAIAMMQALYSRSAESVSKHAEKVKTSGSKKFMESYYVGYGHASIGDCGVTTMFIEGVSILAAKALQDNPLYSGQETSTRYIDFSSQEIFDPVSTKESKKIQNNWISFYTKNIIQISNHLKECFPLQNNESENIWEKAIKARAFDILRGFLPSGATTQLSWTTNLRQAHEKLSLLKHHPLSEVRKIAKSSLDALKEKYPSSFSHKSNPAVEGYYEKLCFDFNYSNYKNEQWDNDTFISTCNIDNQLLELEALDVISTRPKWATLPKFLERYGQYTCKFLLDYGSFRDLQRHRNGLCRIPLLSNKHGFNNWYLEQLPNEIKQEARSLLKEQFIAIDKLKKRHSLDDSELQYYFPMGCNVNCELVYSLPQMVYVAELRSNSTVHPTLRKIAHKINSILSSNHPQLKIYCDENIDSWDIKRGKQDIVRKK